MPRSPSGRMIRPVWSRPVANPAVSAVDAFSGPVDAMVLCMESCDLAANQLIRQVWRTPVSFFAARYPRAVTIPPQLLAWCGRRARPKRSFITSVKAIIDEGRPSSVAKRLRSQIAGSRSLSPTRRLFLPTV
jgi:hypothetical protein